MNWKDFRPELFGASRYRCFLEHADELQELHRNLDFRIVVLVATQLVYSGRFTRQLVDGQSS